MLGLAGRGPEASRVTSGRVAASLSVILWLVAGIATTLVLSTHALVHWVLALVLLLLLVVHVLLWLTKLIALHVPGIGTRRVLLLGIKVWLSSAVVGVLLLLLIELIVVHVVLCAR